MRISSIERKIFYENFALPFIPKQCPELVYGVRFIPLGRRPNSRALWENLKD